MMKSELNKNRLIYISALVFIFISLNIYSFDYEADKSLNSLIETESRYSAGGRILKPCYSAAADKLYVFSEDPGLYIFSGNSIHKKIKLSSAPLFSPAEGIDGTLYCVFKDRTLRAYNMGGKLKWLKKLSSYPVFPPLVNSMGNITVFLSDNTVSSYALNGRLRWKRETGISADSKPLSLRRGIIFNDSDSYKIISDLGLIKAVPKKGNGFSYIAASGRLFVINENTENIQISLEDRSFNKKWTADISGIPCDIKIHKGIIFLLTDKGYFYRIDMKGHILKKKRVDSSGTGSFTVLEKYIYLVNSGSSSIKLFSHDFEFTDRIKIASEAVSGMKSARINNNYFPEAVFAGGSRIVLGGNDWILYFFNISDTEETDSGIVEDYSPDDYIYRFTDSLHYIQQLSKSDRYENKMKSLSLIEDFINEGGLNTHEYEILDILFRLGTEGTVTINRNSLDGNSGAVLRSRASELIYSAGTQHSLSLIRKMINAENDEYVIIKDITLLGKAGSDPGLETYKSFRRVLERSRYDKRICSSVVSASEDIAVYNGYLPKEYSSMLMEMMDIHSDTDLKNKIIRLLVKKQY